MDKNLFEKLEAGDRILFNDRKVPLVVESREKDRLRVKGPQGGEYVIFRAEETGDLLVRNRGGSRRYASYVENLRKAGRWQKKSRDTWKHSKSGEKIELRKKETGFWSIDTGLELDLPRYGYSSREHAEEEVEKLIENNPEG